MKSAKAISLLTAQRDKLSQVISYEDSVWKTQTRSVVRDIFGERSEEDNYMQDFSYLSLYTPEHRWQQEFLKSKKDVERFLNSCIDTIKERGVPKKTKMNFLYTANHEALAAIFLAICGGIFSIGYIVGENSQYKDLLRLEHEVSTAEKTNRNQTDTITSLRNTITILTDSSRRDTER
jgi:hypothetical protein